MSTELKIQQNKFEPRYPIVLSVLFVILLFVILPERMSLFPHWFAYIIGTLLIIPILAVGISHANPVWLKIEYYFVRVFIVIVGLANLLNLGVMTDLMIKQSSEISGVQLLASSIAYWVVNVFIFSILYWQIDRGGPESRANDLKCKPEWMFPQDSAPEEFVSENWRPVFVDYLYLGYSTATAFSTTETTPMTSRAKILMMFESAISLITILLVAARAINILGN
jgi:hypothetical protein